MLAKQGCAVSFMHNSMLVLCADPRRPSLEDMLDDYWRIMPEYQGVTLDRLQPQRILFGFFPTYRDSPLQPGFDRVLQVGDASGIQSPLSFGGFGALTRHMPRLVPAISEALEVLLIVESHAWVCAMACEAAR